MTKKVKDNIKTNIDKNHIYCKLFLSFNFSKIFELRAQNMFLFTINVNLLCWSVKHKPIATLGLCY